MDRVMFSSMSDHWSTPDSVYKILDDEFHFTFDPCPLRSLDNGVNQRWTGNVFCNPPYSRIKEFMVWGLGQLEAEFCQLIVFLIPSRTDTKWFHDYVLPRAEIRFIKGRLKFGDAKNSAPFPSMVCVFRRNNNYDSMMRQNTRTMISKCVATLGKAR